MGLLEGIKVPTNYVVASAGACIVGGVIGGLITKKILSTSSTDILPEKWVKVGEIKNLMIYPVKTLQGISVKEAVLASIGIRGVEGNPLLRDRVFVVVDNLGNCISQKKIPILALISVRVEGNKLHLSQTKDPSLDITIEIPTTTGKDSSTTRVATLFGEKIKAIDCGDEIATWLSIVTETPDLRLLYHAEEETQRGPVKRNIRFHTYRASHLGTFHDETSYMLMTDESVAALNTHLEKPVSHLNFRPTIILSGVSEPFAEDFWGYIRIGKQDDSPVLKTSRPCIRCALTTVEPETGTFRTDGEPLRTLNRLKRPVGDSKISKLTSKAAVMGAHFGVFQGEGSIIRVGDPVYAAVL